MVGCSSTKYSPVVRSVLVVARYTGVAAPCFKNEKGRGRGEGRGGESRVEKMNT